MDQHEAFDEADLSRAEVVRRAGGAPPGTTDAGRQRLLALLEPSVAGESRRPMARATMSGAAAR